MGLNIKNERVHDLARQAAALTGKSQTGAIEEALTRLLEARGADPATTETTRRIAAAQEVIARYARDPGRDGEIRTVEDLFDAATGLPRR